MAEALIKYEQLVERLGIERSALRKMVQSRQIPVIKINGRVHRFKWSEVEAAIARLTVKAV